jgi:hypothetical protein
LIGWNKLIDLIIIKTQNLDFVSLNLLTFVNYVLQQQRKKARYRENKQKELLNKKKGAPYEATQNPSAPEAQISTGSSIISASAGQTSNSSILFSDSPTLTSNSSCSPQPSPSLHMQYGKVN